MRKNERLASRERSSRFDSSCLLSSAWMQAGPSILTFISLSIRHSLLSKSQTDFDLCKHVIPFVPVPVYNFYLIKSAHGRSQDEQALWEVFYTYKATQEQRSSVSDFV